MLSAARRGVLWPSRIADQARMDRPSASDGRGLDDLGPPFRVEIHNTLPNRLQTSGTLNPDDDRLNAAVAHTVFGHGDVRPLGQPPHADVSSAPAGFLRGRSVLRVRVLPA